MRTIQPSTKVYVDRTTSPHPNHYRAAKDAVSRMHRMYGTENVARCHRCPHGSFCQTCNDTNRSRISLGLLRPKHQGDHANNILYPIPITRKAKVGTPPALRFGRSSGRLLGGRVKALGGGWYQGIATIDGVPIYEGDKTRIREAAQAFVTESIGEISDALAMGVVFDV